MVPKPSGEAAAAEEEGQQLEGADHQQHRGGWLTEAEHRRRLEVAVRQASAAAAARCTALEQAQERTVERLRRRLQALEQRGAAKDGVAATAQAQAQAARDRASLLRCARSAHACLRSAAARSEHFVDVGGDQGIARRL